MKICPAPCSRRICGRTLGRMETHAGKWPECSCEDCSGNYICPRRMTVALRLLVLAGSLAMALVLLWPEG